MRSIACVFMAGDKLHYILCVLNSKLAEWYFWFIATKSGMGTTRWYKGTVEQLPLAKVAPNQEEAIETLVDRILAAKKKDPEAFASPCCASSGGGIGGVTFR